MARPEQDPDQGPDAYIGRRVGDRYRVLRKLGQGGMGTVYLAEHALIERRVALKILSAEHAADRAVVQRLIGEARAAAAIRHRNIVDVYDFGETEDAVYIAMEYLEGEDLYNLIRREGALPAPRIRKIVSQIGRALSAAHAQGIIHRDLKPENVRVLQQDGHPDFVKVLDFGLARRYDNEDRRERLTRVGTIVGTPEYMAPEQVTGQALDHRADIYALGCLIYELLTGKPPFVGDQVMLVLSMHLFATAPPPSEVVGAQLAPDLEGACKRAMLKDPAHRFQSMQELLEALAPEGVAPMMSGPQPLASAALAIMAASAPGSPPAPAPAPSAAPASVPAPSAPETARRRPPALALGAVALCLVVAGILGLRFSSRARPKPVAAAPVQPPAPQPEKEPRSPPLVASARIVIASGTVGAEVLLNGRQRLGRIPLDIELPLLMGAAQERGRLVVRHPGCVPQTISVLLAPGGRSEIVSQLTCKGRGASRRVRKAVASRSKVVAAVKKPKGRAALPAKPKQEAKKQSGDLHDPFAR